MSLQIGEHCPDFTVTITGNKTVCLQDLKGRPFILYFYPKDDTPGCTQEAKDFCQSHLEFAQKGVRIYGVSRDNLQSHDRFKEKYALPFDLIIDEQEELCRLFDVIKTKNLFGKLTQGIERSTFLFNGKGELVRAWRGVKVDGHVRAVRESVDELCQNHAKCC